MYLGPALGRQLSWRHMLRRVLHRRLFRRRLFDRRWLRDRNFLGPLGTPAAALGATH